MLDKKVLIDYCDLQAETRLIREKIEETICKISKLEKENVSDVVSGGMGGWERFKITGVPNGEIRKQCELLKKRQAKLEERETEKLEALNLAEEFIESIEKTEMRIMFRLKYIEGFTWNQVAERMNMMYPKRKIAYTDENCRQKNKRFFEEN